MSANLHFLLALYLHLIMLFHQWRIICLHRNWIPEYHCQSDPQTFELGHGARFLYYEPPYVAFGVRNTIVVISTGAPASKGVVVNWNSADTQLQITSAMHIYSDPDERFVLAGGVARLVCAKTQMNHSYFLEDSRLLLDGVVCSFWLQPSSPIQVWTRVQSGSKLWASLLSRQLNSEILFASTVLSSSEGIHHIDASTQVGLVTGFLDRQSSESSSTTADYFVDQKKPWISRFSFSTTPPTHVPSSLPQNHPVWTPQEPVNQALHGWLSNSESSLWFGGNVQFHRIAAIGQKYFYVILTEDDVVSASVPTDSESIFRTVRVTRIARVCQNDPGQGKAGEFLATNGVFSTFRKIRLQCRVDHSVGAPRDENKSLGADHNPQLELTRALAVSELIPTVDGRDHVFYAVMTTSDPITGILGICAFSLQSVDEALNRPQVFTWQTVDSNNWLQQFWRTVLPLTGWSSASDDDFTYSASSTVHPTPGSSTLRILGNTPMIEAITKSAATCSSTPLPEYYARFATLHPLVASSTLAFESLPDGTRQFTGNALTAFTIPHAVEGGLKLPTSMTVKWAISDGVDVIHLGTDDGRLLVMATGFALASTHPRPVADEQITPSQSFVPHVPKHTASFNPPFRFLVQLNATLPVKRVFLGGELSQHNAELPPIIVVTELSLKIFTIIRTNCQRIETLRSPDNSFGEAQILTTQKAGNASLDEFHTALRVMIPAVQPRPDTGANKDMLVLRIAIGLIACCVPVAIIFGFILGRRNYKPQRGGYQASGLESLRALSDTHQAGGYQTLTSGTPIWTPVRACLLEHSIQPDDERVLGQSPLYRFVPTCSRNNCINAIARPDTIDRLLRQATPIMGLFKPPSAQPLVSVSSDPLSSPLVPMSVMHNQLDV